MEAKVDFDESNEIKMVNPPLKEIDPDAER